MFLRGSYPFSFTFQDSWSYDPTYRFKISSDLVHFLLLGSVSGFIPSKKAFLFTLQSTMAERKLNVLSTNRSYALNRLRGEIRFGTDLVINLKNGSAFFNVGNVYKGNRSLCEFQDSVVDLSDVEVLYSFGMYRLPLSFSFCSLLLHLVRLIRDMSHVRKWLQ